MGLAISSQLVKMMGGKIGVKSAPEKGSTFFFTIKAKVASETGDPSNRILPNKEEHSYPEGRQIHILLAEDNEMNQKLVAIMLKNNGFTCDIAVDGRETLQKVLMKDYDIILMDCQMPVMDGYETTARIRAMEKYRRRTMIIAMTANAMEGDREKCIEAGMDDYISKPITINVLLSTIRKYATSQKERLDGAVFDTGLGVFMAETGIDAETAKDLFLAFIQRLPALLNQIETSVGSGNYREASSLAHNLKGSSGNLRLKAIHELAQKLETSAKQNDETECKTLLGAIKAAAGF